MLENRDSDYVPVSTVLVHTYSQAALFKIWLYRQVVSLLHRQHWTIPSSSDNSINATMPKTRSSNRNRINDADWEKLVHEDWEGEEEEEDAADDASFDRKTKRSKKTSKKDTPMSAVKKNNAANKRAFAALNFSTTPPTNNGVALFSENVNGTLVVKREYCIPSMEVLTKLVGLNFDSLSEKEQKAVKRGTKVSFIFALCCRASGTVLDVYKGHKALFNSVFRIPHKKAHNFQLGDKRDVKSALTLERIPSRGARYDACVAEAAANNEELKKEILEKEEAFKKEYRVYGGKPIIRMRTIILTPSGDVAGKAKDLKGVTAALGGAVDPEFVDNVTRLRELKESLNGKELPWEKRMLIPDDLPSDVGETLAINNHIVKRVSIEEYERTDTSEYSYGCSLEQLVEKRKRGPKNGGYFAVYEVDENGVPSKHPCGKDTFKEARARINFRVKLEYWDNVDRIAKAHKKKDLRTLKSADRQKITYLLATDMKDGIVVNGYQFKIIGKDEYEFEE